MPHQGGSKENVPPPDAVVPQLSRLSLNENPPTPKNLAIQPPNPPGRTEEERQTHQRFTNDALDMVSSEIPAVILLKPGCPPSCVSQLTHTCRLVLRFVPMKLPSAVSWSTTVPSSRRE